MASFAIAAKSATPAPPYHPSRPEFNSEPDFSLEEAPQDRRAAKKVIDMIIHGLD